MTDKNGIPLSAVISPASTHDIKLVTEVVDNAVIKRPSSSKPQSRRKGMRRRLQHLCLDKAYNSIQEEQELIKRGYVLHISPKRNRGKEEVQVTTQPCLNRKKHSARRWVVERKLMAQQIQETVYPI